MTSKAFLTMVARGLSSTAQSRGEQHVGAYVRSVALEFPICAYCAGEIRPLARAGRMRELYPGVVLPVPEDFEIPTCNGCGDEYMSPQLTQVLHGILTEMLNRI